MGNADGVFLFQDFLGRKIGNIAGNTAVFERRYHIVLVYKVAAGKIQNPHAGTHGGDCFRVDGIFCARQAGNMKGDIVAIGEYSL
ncbi:hypothetical protein SDC9_189163 [bioreactor metagenome]|uniref:Uncharacterized protein n=1 Tax=bioreactor metagenome TaxID=1076179 RepID=A0A645HTT3_9ZZZZ